MVEQLLVPLVGLDVVHQCTCCIGGIGDMTGPARQPPDQETVDCAEG